MGRIILVTGGARSGKSSYAEQLAADAGGDVAYIATARALDAEMKDRIARHQAQRPSSWQTVETTLHPSLAIGEQQNRVAVVLLDCLSVLITNHMLACDIDWELTTMNVVHAVEQDILTEIKAIITTVHSGSSDLIAVTNEVGFGIVPASPMARFFRDCAGRVNQTMASAADQVYLVVSGLPMQLKG